MTCNYCKYDFVCNEAFIICNQCFNKLHTLCYIDVKCSNEQITELEINKCTRCNSGIFTFTAPQLSMHVLIHTEQSIWNLVKQT